MIDLLPSLVSRFRQETYLLFRRYRNLNRSLLSWPDLTYEFDRFVETDAGKALADSEMRSLIYAIQEAVIHGPSFFLAVRTRVARWSYLQFHSEDLMCREISVSEYLAQKERLVQPNGREAPREASADVDKLREGTELTFTLRDDVYWHDGHRTDAYDVEFTYLRATDPATAYPNLGRREPCPVPCSKDWPASWIPTATCRLCASAPDGPQPKSTK